MITSRIAELEAMLFAYGEPVPLKKIALILKMNEAELREALAAMKEELAREARGLFLTMSDDAVQLVTKPRFETVLNALLKEEFQETLTPAALETLSIICYAGPIARSEIDYIRGVNSSFTVRSLLVRGLVERSPHPQRPHLYLYRPTLKMVHHLGMQSVRDLPEYDRLQSLVATLRGAPEEHINT